MNELQSITEDHELLRRQENRARTILWGRLIRTVVNTWAYLGFWIIATEYVVSSASNGNTPSIVGYLTGLLLGVAVGLWSWVRHDAEAMSKELQGE